MLEIWMTSQNSNIKKKHQKNRRESCIGLQHYMLSLSLLRDGLLNAYQRVEGNEQASFWAAKSAIGRGGKNGTLCPIGPMPAARTELCVKLSKFFA